MEKITVRIEKSIYGGLYTTKRVYKKGIRVLGVIVKNPYTNLYEATLYNYDKRSYDVKEFKFFKDARYYILKNNYNVEVRQNIEDDWKKIMKETKAIEKDVTRSDLQGIVSAESLKLMRIFNIPIDRREEVEDIFLEYIDGELDINSAKRYLLDLRKK